MTRFFAFTALLIAAAIPQAAFAADPIFIVRHLQKAPDGTNPPLSAKGAANAQTLANMLAKSGIRAIYATPTRRAMETAKPLAAKLGLTVMAYDPANPDALVKAAAAVGGAILVVGHSDTVPDLIARFGGKQQVALGDQDYGTVFVVSHDGGKVSEIQIRSR